MKKLIAMTLALALLLVGSSAMATLRTVETMYVVGCKQSVSLRAEPSTSSTALAQIPRRAKVEALAYNDTFTWVRYNGQSGYVLNDYLDVDPEGDIGMYMWVVNCKEWVSLRAEASTGARVIVEVPLGARVWVDSDENGFYGCEYNGLFGYILMDYLESYM